MQSRPLAAGLTVSKWPGPRLGDTAAGLPGRDGREARACGLHPPPVPGSMALRATARPDLRTGALGGVLGLLGPTLPGPMSRPVQSRQRWLVEPPLLLGTPLLTVGLGGPASGLRAHPSCPGVSVLEGMGPREPWVCTRLPVEMALNSAPKAGGQGPRPCQG